MFFNGVPITDPWNWGWTIAGILITVMIISVFVKIIIRIVRGEHCHRRRCDFYAEQGGAYAAARTILDERYAKGEIDDEEYRRKKENLR